MNLFIGTIGNRQLACYHESINEGCISARAEMIFAGWQF